MLYSDIVWTSLGFSNPKLGPRLHPFPLILSTLSFYPTVLGYNEKRSPSEEDLGYEREEFYDEGNQPGRLPFSL